MNILLDTHTFLWYITGDIRIPQKMLTLINDNKNDCCVSIASIWEIVIKMTLNKLEIKGGFKTIEDFLENNDFEILPINFNHTKRLLSLPLLHKDPFDRIIIAQSICENLTIVSKDRRFVDYDIKIVW
jgi:PIN domain nuclease of toxin-antitoxin system